jgi:hypothetical protein
MASPLAFVQVCFVSDPESRTIIRKASNVHLSNVGNAELEGIALPHRIYAPSLESFAWLRLCFYPEKKTVVLEDFMRCSP